MMNSIIPFFGFATGNTSNLSWHKTTTFLSKEVSPRVEPSKEWLMELKYTYETIHILSPSMTLSCSLMGTFLETLHNPTIGANILSQFLVETLLGKIPLVSTRLIFECCGMARPCPSWSRRNRGLHRFPHLFFWKTRLPACINNKR